MEHKPVIEDVWVLADLTKNREMCFCLKLSHTPAGQLTLFSHAPRAV